MIVLWEPIVKEILVTPLRFGIVIKLYISIVFEEEPLDLLLALHRRKVGQRYEIGALVVPTFGLELRSALVVDQTRYRVGEGSLLGVFVDLAANRIAMHQPSRTELQDRIQPLRKSGPR